MLDRCSRRYVIEHLNHINQDEVIIQQLEDWINSIHRESLNGETAHAYDSRLARLAIQFLPMRKIQFHMACVIVCVIVLGKTDAVSIEI